MEPLMGFHLVQWMGQMTAQHWVPLTDHLRAPLLGYHWVRRKGRLTARPTELHWVSRSESKKDFGSAIERATR